MAAYITAPRPGDVARDVEHAKRRGCTVFTLRSVDRGGMLDRERIGAALYAAGVQSRVELESGVASAQRR